MLVPIEYVYLIACLPLLALWLFLFIIRSDERREMLVMSILIGIISVATAHYWWTFDWWHPTTVTGTRVGLEDFLMGFASGGIIAVAYEIIFKKRNSRIRSRCLHCPGGFTILLLLAFLTSWLVWGVQLTSFWASTIALLVVASVVFFFRKDLFISGILSGLLMLGASVLFYGSIALLSPEWAPFTYQLDSLSGRTIVGFPVEEFIFWFLAGLVFGPFYEYWKGERFLRVRS